MTLINLFVTSLLTQNIVLNKFLGICPFMGTSKSEKNALHMGLSVTFVITLSSVITYLLYNFVLVPTNTEYLKTIMFILVISSVVQILDIVLKKYFKNIHKTLGLYLPLITTNCAVLGITLLNITNEYNILEVLVYSIGSSLGFTLVIYVFSTIRERLEQTNIPESFKGTPIALITAFIMSLLFMRFTLI
ncbi:MAG: RnfABCDGE type electron transport complex subunit A [Bacilli bacterium]|nr:RnfABCDGE type electron transport complex subunit A [Bacilli bacterium]